MGSGISKKHSEKPVAAAPKKKGKTFQLKCLQGHEGAINAICLSPDGNTIITVSEDKTGILWDTKTEEFVEALTGHTKYITSVCVWERYVFTSSADTTIRKWNLESGSCVKEMKGHIKAVNRVICSGNFIFSSSYDRTVMCWRAETGERLKTFVGHKSSVISLLVVSESSYHGGGGGAFAPVDIEDNHDTLISGSADGTAKSWAMNSNDCTVTYKGHTEAVMCLAVDGKGKTLFSGSADHTIRSWDILTGTPVRSFKGHQGSIIQIQVVNKMLYSSSSDGTAKCWVIEFGDCTRTYKGFKSSVTQMHFQDGILFTSGDKFVKAFDAKSGTSKRIFSGHTASVGCLMVSSGRLYTGSCDNTLRIWDATKLRDDEDDIYSNGKENGVKK